MEGNILKDTKKILGLDPEYTAFDHDIMTHLMASFSTLSQIGVGPCVGFFLEEETSWNSLNLSNNQLNLVRTYVFLKVRMLFDPPTTSYLIENMNKQIDEYEYRLKILAEQEAAWEPTPEEVTP